MPGPPGIVAPQHSRPSSQGFSVPDAHWQPSPVHTGEGVAGLQSAVAVQMPAPPGMLVSPWQQTRPSSQAP